ncbi:hypothetical protein AMAG_03731 [Allomyces macrogynus ATCC 38327]|uniref:Uncharacterized protein n=1 Tax=Allomyces macrogynus (strain ATCC 38327) TaxID=578462 RepID=A0A0L0SA78_ALLM3|nr:hypothetical protein AMAG_03731 [Allomyces macrogynus ATCC 38327]|eukprot:KNE59453.1 hypothetical protein AMAG_03731 [Allomyces macrogynus ATCC 38327]
MRRVDRNSGLSWTWRSRRRRRRTGTRFRRACACVSRSWRPGRQKCTSRLRSCFHGKSCSKGRLRVRASMGARNGGRRSRASCQVLTRSQCRRKSRRRKVSSKVPVVRPVEEPVGDVVSEGPVQDVVEPTVALGTAEPADSIQSGPVPDQLTLLDRVMAPVQGVLGFVVNTASSLSPAMWRLSTVKKTLLLLVFALTITNAVYLTLILAYLAPMIHRSPATAPAAANSNSSGADWSWLPFGPSSPASAPTAEIVAPSPLSPAATAPPAGSAAPAPTNVEAMMYVMMSRMQEMQDEMAHLRSAFRPVGVRSIDDGGAEPRYHPPADRARADAPSPTAAATADREHQRVEVVKSDPVVASQEYAQQDKGEYQAWSAEGGQAAPRRADL